LALLPVEAGDFGAHDPGLLGLRLRSSALDSTSNGWECGLSIRLT